MKKSIVFSLCTLFVLGCNISFGESASVTEPQWAEFCPPLYENATFKHAKENSKRDLENNYWALRKVKFEKSVAECKVLAKSQSELGSCYARVANIERNKSNQRQQARNEKLEDTSVQIRDGGFWWY